MTIPRSLQACLLFLSLASPAVSAPVPPGDDRRPFLLGGIQLNEDDHERWAAALIQAGMNAVEVTAYAHQGAWNTAELWYEEEEPSVLAEIRAARRNGLAVVLVLRVALDHNDPANRFLWHGLIFPETERQLAAWFEAYGDFVVQWARIAQTQGVEVLGLASEMNSLLATLPVDEIPELPAYYLDDAKQRELRDLVGRTLHRFGEEDRIAMGAGDVTSIDDFLVERNAFERRWARAYTFAGDGEVPAEERIAAIHRRRRVLDGHWRRLIERVRAVYGGRLTVAANFDNYHEVSFWDALDLIGINAYFPLRETLETPLEHAALVESWRGVFAGVEAFRRERKLRQDVVFTELGYTRRRGVTVAPWSSSGFVPMWGEDGEEDSVLLWSAQPIEPAERALAVSALHAAWRRDDLPLAGVLYWKLSSRAELGRYEPFMLYLGEDSDDPLLPAFRRFAEHIRPFEPPAGREPPLNVAVRLGRGDDVRRLVAEGVDLSARDDHGYLALHWSCYQHDPSLVALLVPPETVVWRDDLDETPLHKCARLDNAAVARALLRLDGDLAVAGGDGTPLELAADLASAEMVELLLAHGADAGAADAEGVTPLHVAARRGDPEIVELLARSAGAAIEDAVGNRPVAYAAYHGKAQAFRRLWRPEDAKRINAGGQSLLHLAAHGGDAGIVETLLQHGLAVDRVDGSGRTPLHYAVMKTHRPIARLLLERGAAVDRAGRDGQTPLHLAAEKDDPGLLRLVLARASSPDLVGAGGNTPLHVAAGWGRLDNVRLLLAASARPAVRNRRGQTALQVAEEAGRKRVAELLSGLDREVAASASSKIR